MIRLSDRCWLTHDGRLVIRIEEMRTLNPRTNAEDIKYQVILNLCGDSGATCLYDIVVDSLDVAAEAAKLWAKKIGSAREDG